MNVNYILSVWHKQLHVSRVETHSVSKPVSTAGP